MAQADLSTHSAAIHDALTKVRNNQGIDWLLLSFEGKTNSMHVSETGNGLDDLAEAFNDGKIEFAYARVIDENSQLPKNVFISWCGEGVPENKKGLLQLHTQAVDKLVKGYHVHVAARHSKDVEKANIMKKVRDSSGANYSFHKETKPAVADKPQAVGSSYQKPEIMGRSKDVTPSAFTKPADDGAEKRKADEERRKQELEDRKRFQEEEQRKKAEEEAQSRAAVDAKRKAGEDESRRKREVEDESRRKREAEERQRAEDEEERRQQSAAAAPPARSAPAPAPAAPAPAAGGKTATAAYDYEATESNELNFQAGDLITGVEVVDDGWWQGYNPAGQYGMFPANYVTENDGGDASAPAAAYEEPAPVEEAAPEASGGDGAFAVAIYEYTAADDGEISFVVGETITEIVVVDENWWQGKNGSGYFGMFPSSYVQSQ